MFPSCLSQKECHLRVAASYLYIVFPFFSQIIYFHIIIIIVGYILRKNRLSKIIQQLQTCFCKMVQNIYTPAIILQSTVDTLVQTLDKVGILVEIGNMLHQCALVETCLCPIISLQNKMWMENKQQHIYTKYRQIKTNILK